MSFICSLHTRIFNARPKHCFTTHHDPQKSRLFWERWRIQPKLGQSAQRRTPQTAHWYLAQSQNSCMFSFKQTRWVLSEPPSKKTLPERLKGTYRNSKQCTLSSSNQITSTDPLCMNTCSRVVTKVSVLDSMTKNLVSICLRWNLPHNHWLINRCYHTIVDVSI